MSDPIPDDITCRTVALIDVGADLPTFSADLFLTSIPPNNGSAGYIMRRLGRERPDLLDRVMAGELSPHGAMIEAGFKPKAIVVPLDPATAGRRLARHFTPEQFVALTEAYREARGV